LYTKTTGFLFQAANEQQVNDWLYSIDPLFVGSQRSRTGTVTRTHSKSVLNFRF